MKQRTHPTGLPRSMKHVVPFIRLAISVVTLFAVALSAADKPNIVVILADDMGYSDLGCYGGEIQTPNLDRLAAGGLRFTQFYNTARCCPTRASLLTGLYPHQAGIGHMMDDKGLDGYRGDLNRRCVTIAEALKPAGYRTYMAGKWHVTAARQPRTDRSTTGRSSAASTGSTAPSTAPAASTTRRTLVPRQHVHHRRRPIRSTARRSSTTPMPSPTTPSGSSATTPREHAAQPFFLYVAYTAAHWPMHALAEDIAKYQRPATTRATTPIRAGAAEPGMKQLGLIDAALATVAAGRATGTT